MTDETRDPAGYQEPNDDHPHGDQKGAQRHAEGSQGPKTRQRFKEQLHSGPSGESRDEHDFERELHADTGEHRLFERREQHDEAELNSEKNRLDRDIREHDHNRENFQVRGGAESSRVEPRSHINPTHPDAPTPGEPPPPEPQRIPRGKKS